MQRLGKRGQSARRGAHHFIAVKPIMTRATRLTRLTQPTAIPMTIIFQILLQPTCSFPFNKQYPSVNKGPPFRQGKPSALLEVKSPNIPTAIYEALLRGYDRAGR